MLCFFLTPFFCGKSSIWIYTSSHLATNEVYLDFLKVFLCFKKVHFLPYTLDETYKLIQFRKGKMDLPNLQGIMCHVFFLRGAWFIDTWGVLFRSDPFGTDDRCASKDRLGFVSPSCQDAWTAWRKATWHCDFPMVNSWYLLRCLLGKQVAVISINFTPKSSNPLAL